MLSLAAAWRVGANRAGNPSCAESSGPVANCVRVCGCDHTWHPAAAATEAPSPSPGREVWSPGPGSGVEGGASAGLQGDLASTPSLRSAKRAHIVISATPCAQPKTQGRSLPGDKSAPREPAVLLKPPSRNAEAGPHPWGHPRAAPALSESTAPGTRGWVS